MKNLDKPSVSVMAVQDQWETVDSLYGGTTTMREARELLLPKEPKESELNYDARINRTTLLNAYKRTIGNSVGKVFSREIIIDTDSEEVLVLLNDVDQTGRDVTEFSQSVFADALNKGVSYILVDHTVANGTGPDGVVTLADEQEQGARPYWVHIKASQLLSAITEIINGMEILTYFRYMEERSTFNEETHEEELEIVIRVLQLDLETGAINYQLWTNPEANANGVDSFQANTQYRERGYSRNSPLEATTGGEWIMDEDESGTLSSNMTRIPIVPVCVNRISSYLGSPPLMDLAEKNIEYWQSYSDQKNILHYARVPIFTISAAKPLQDPDEDHEETMELSGNTVLDLGKDGKAAWVEHGGQAIGAGRQDIQDIKAEMAVLGLELHVSQPGGETATAKAINNAETNSWLKAMALTLRNSIERAIIYSAQYGGFPPEQIGDVIVNTEYSIPFRDSADMKDLLEMYREGLLDATTVLSEAKRRNLLYYTTDIDDLALLATDGVDNDTTETE